MSTVSRSEGKAGGLPETIRTAIHNTIIAIVPKGDKTSLPMAMAAIMLGSSQGLSAEYLRANCLQKQGNGARDHPCPNGGSPADLQSIVPAIFYPPVRMNGSLADVSLSPMQHPSAGNLGRAAYEAFQNRLRFQGEGRFAEAAGEFEKLRNALQELDAASGSAR